jgi:hypothetical protein
LIHVVFALYVGYAYNFEMWFGLQQWNCCYFAVYNSDVWEVILSFAWSSENAGNLVHEKYQGQTSAQGGPGIVKIARGREIFLRGVVVVVVVVVIWSILE